MAKVMIALLKAFTKTIILCYKDTVYMKKIYDIYISDEKYGEVAHEILAKTELKARKKYLKKFPDDKILRIKESI